MEKKTKKEIMRGIPDGGQLTLRLDGESYGAWTQRAREVNAEDGWEHYEVSRNARFGTLIIIANMAESTNQ